MSDQTYTILVKKRLKWWKIPFAMLRRKPWRWVDQYTNCKITSFEIDVSNQKTSIRWHLTSMSDLEH